MIRAPAAVLAVLLAGGWACLSQPATPAARGREIYRQRCASCHGEDLRGKRTAPALVGLSRNWSPQRLARYLDDPTSLTQSDPRLLHLSGAYTLRMPAFRTMPPAEREDLLAFLLGAATTPS